MPGELKPEREAAVGPLEYDVEPPQSKKSVTLGAVPRLPTLPFNVAVVLPTAVCVTVVAEGAVTPATKV